MPFLTPWLFNQTLFNLRCAIISAVFPILYRGPIGVGQGVNTGQTFCGSVIRSLSRERGALGGTLTSVFPPCRTGTVEVTEVGYFSSSRSVSL